MADGKVRKLRVAAVQMESKNGLIDVNLEHASGFVNEAVQKGAKLILLPEFMPTGYVMSTAIWDAGEPREGKTVKWLKETSRKHRVYIGTSFLEADGEDFFNTFVMTNAAGEEIGSVRKQTPALFEAYFTKGDGGSHILNSEFGKVGVGICYENHLSYLPPLMHEQSVDLMIMPHSAPTFEKSIINPSKLIKAYNDSLKNVAFHYAKILGVPTVFANKSGPWNTTLPGLPLVTQHSSFPGFTNIVDSDGTVKAQMGDEEGVIVEDVTLDPSRKIKTPPQCYGRYSMEIPVSPIMSSLRAIMFPLVEAIGGFWYSHSSERKRRANRISSQV